MKANESLSQQAITLIVAKGISFLLTLSIPLLLVRYLSQSEFGAYKQSLLLYTTVANLLPWGMAQSLYYFIPKSPEHRRGYLANTFIFLFVVGLFALLACSLSGHLLESYFHSEALAKSAPLLGIYMFFMTASIYAEVALVAENRTRAAAGVIILNEVAKALALIGSALLTHSYAGIMAGLACAAAIRFLILTCYFRRDLAMVKAGPNIELLRKQLRYSLPFGLMVLLLFAQDYFHQYYISYTFSPADFAIYAIGCLELPLVDLFYSSIGDVAMVKMAECLRNHDRVGARQTWHEAMIKLAVIFLPLTAYMTVVRKEFIIALFTERYQASAPILLVTLAAMPLTILLVDPVMRVFGETRYLLFITALRLPLTITLVIVSLALMGMIGGVISTSIMVLLARGALLMRIQSLMKCAFKELLPWRNLMLILVASISAALPAESLLIGLRLTPKFALIVTAPIYGLIFLLVGIWLDIFPAEERQMLKELCIKYFAYLPFWSNKPAIINTDEAKP